MRSGVNWIRHFYCARRRRRRTRFHAGARAALAQIYALKGDEAAAKRELQEALRLAPTNNPEANMIAACYELLHDSYSAIQYYKQSIQHDRQLGQN